MGSGTVGVEDGGVLEDEPRHGRRRLMELGTVLGHGRNDSDQTPTPAVVCPRQAVQLGLDPPVTLGGSDTVLCSGTLRAGITLRERLAAAQAGGFTVCRSGGATIKWRVTKGSATRTSACC